MTEHGDDHARTPSGDGAEKPLVLTRAALLDGSLHRLIARKLPDVKLLTDDERAASLHGILAARPEAAGTDAWLFAYGSLIWNPTVHYAERRVAIVQGWHRAFCLSVRAGRGTPDNPGLMLGLDVGGECRGVAYRIAAEHAEAELHLLWRREMVSGAYVPRWVTLLDADGTGFAHGIVFTINPEANAYTGVLDEEEIVRRLATAQGELGSAAEYLFRTRDGLHGLGIRDALVDRLAEAVARIHAGEERA
ncbi:MAG TPA: gamma-glutamylcyclotransferase [Acetobacteraceae bacterium]|nr:gamma-glutamylcyclotransferase [Acetobacteraceae bacterium]